MDDVIKVGAIEIRYHLTASQTGGGLTMFDFLVPSQAKVPIAHYHEAFDETIYGLEGVMTFTVGGREVRTGLGDVLFIPRGEVHQFVNRDSAPARGLSVITPGILGPEYFQEVAAVLSAGGPPDMAKVGAVMQKHGLRPAAVALG